jgi:hypothetical protein
VAWSALRASRHAGSVVASAVWTMSGEVVIVLLEN